MPNSNKRINKLLIQKTRKLMLENILLTERKLNKKILMLENKLHNVLLVEAALGDFVILRNNKVVRDPRGLFRRGKAGKYAKLTADSAKSIFSSRGPLDPNVKVYRVVGYENGKSVLAQVDARSGQMRSSALTTSNVVKVDPKAVAKAGIIKHGGVRGSKIPLPSEAQALGKNLRKLQRDIAKEIRNAKDMAQANRLRANAIGRGLGGEIVDNAVSNKQKVITQKASQSKVRRERMKQRASTKGDSLARKAERMALEKDPKVKQFIDDAIAKSKKSFRSGNIRGAFKPLEQVVYHSSGRPIFISNQPRVQQHMRAMARKSEKARKAAEESRAKAKKAQEDFVKKQKARQGDVSRQRKLDRAQAGVDTKAARAEAVNKYKTDPKFKAEVDDVVKRIKGPPPMDPADAKSFAQRAGVSNHPKVQMTQKRLNMKATRADHKKLMEELRKARGEGGRIAALKRYLKSLARKSPTLRAFRRLQKRLAKTFGPAYNKVKDLFMQAAQKIKAGAVATGRFLGRRVPSQGRITKMLSKAGSMEEVEKITKKLISRAKNADDLARIKAAGSNIKGKGVFAIDLAAEYAEDFKKAEEGIRTKELAGKGGPKGGGKGGGRNPMNPKGRQVVKPGGKVDQGIKALYAAMQTKAAQYPKTAAALSKVGTAAKFVFKVMPAAFGALELYNLYANWDSNTTEQNIADTVMAGANIALLVAELPVALAFMGGQMAGDAIYGGLLGPIDDVFYQIEKMAKAKMGKLGFFTTGGSTLDTQGAFRLGDGVIGRSDKEGEIFKKAADASGYKGMKPKELNPGYVEKIMITMQATAQAKESGLFAKIRKSDSKPVAKLERLFDYKVLNRFFFEKKFKEWQKKTEQESLQSVGTSLATQQKDGFKPTKTPKGEIVLEITKEDVEKALQDTELLAKIENDPKFEAFKKEVMKSRKNEGGKEKAALEEHYSLRLRKLLLAI